MLPMQRFESTKRRLLPVVREGMPNDGADSGGRNMSEHKADVSEENYQEGVTSVQSFSTPVVPGTESKLRQGRPPRATPAKPCELPEVASTTEAGTQPMTDKQTALSVLQRMPESATLDEISEELALLAAIRRGEAAAKAGRTWTPDSAEKK